MSDQTNQIQAFPIPVQPEVVEATQTPEAPISPEDCYAWVANVPQVVETWRHQTLNGAEEDHGPVAA